MSELSDSDFQPDAVLKFIYDIIIPVLKNSKIVELPMISNK